MPLDVVAVSALSVAANAVSADQMLNQIPQFLTGPVVLRVRVAAAAAGLNMTIIAGGRIMVNDQPVNQSNRWPILPDDLVGEFPYGGGRTIITFRNATGAAIVVVGAVFEFFHR